MKKIQLEVLGISYSQSQAGAYALILGETGEKRRLPIIIGSSEAQAIAIELEKMKPSRPLTHDLFRNFASTFNILINEVIIYKFSQGIFFSKLVCHDGSREVEIDSRTSDAVALAVRFNCPIYTYESILKEAGMVLQDEKEEAGVEPVPREKITTDEEYGQLSVGELETMLMAAIDEEAYERASKIRDEIERRKGKK
ncbi:MAG: bifunctional nuclease family protein [Bacteroides sp.]|jgi:bifunctional DNase/RNase|nr:bifunctional nuclease family protein [Bacteroides sp.]